MRAALMRSTSAGESDVSDREAVGVTVGIAEDTVSSATLAPKSTRFEHIAAVDSASALPRYMHLA